MDKLAAMRVFLKVTDVGSLSGAARELGQSLTSISRQLSSLKAELGIVLVERSTRHLALTEAGELYRERASRILEEVEEAERGLAAHAAIVAGRLRISAPQLLGRMRLSPLLPGFLAQHASVSIDLTLTDRPVRLVEEGIDLALRIGHLEDSDLVARKLDEIQVVVCATPAYLQRRGEPKSPDDINNHDCLGFSDVPGSAEWRFQQNGTDRTLRVRPRLCANDLNTLVDAALCGAGLIRVPSWQIEEHLCARRLVTVLSDYQRPSASLNALFLRNRLLSPKVRLFADYLRIQWSKDKC